VTGCAAGSTGVGACARGRVGAGAQLVSRSLLALCLTLAFAPIALIRRPYPAPAGVDTGGRGARGGNRIPRDRRQHRRPPRCAARPPLLCDPHAASHPPAQIEDALALLAASGVARLEDTSSLYVTRAQYVRTAARPPRRAIRSALRSPTSRTSSTASPASAPASTRVRSCVNSRHFLTHSPTPAAESFNLGREGGREGGGG
jgi:hypothetical protein